MSEFRPSVASLAAPKPSPLRRRSTLFVAAAALAALAAAAMWRAAPPGGTAAPTSNAPLAAPSAWDRAIGSIAGTAPPGATPDDMPGRPALAATELRPMLVGGAVAGYAIGSDVPPPLAEAGLRSGDVLTTIDGLPIDAARAQRLADEFGGLDDVEVTYTRDGVQRDTMIVFRAR